MPWFFIDYYYAAVSAQWRISKRVKVKIKSNYTYCRHWYWNWETCCCYWDNNTHNHNMIILQVTTFRVTLKHCWCRFKLVSSSPAVSCIVDLTGNGLQMSKTWQSATLTNKHEISSTFIIIHTAAITHQLNVSFICPSHIWKEGRIYSVFLNNRNKCALVLQLLNIFTGRAEAVMKDAAIYARYLWIIFTYKINRLI